MLDKRLDYDGLHTNACEAKVQLNNIKQRTENLEEDGDITTDSKLRIRLDAALEAVCALGQHLADQYNEEFECPGRLDFAEHTELEIR
ncbi:MAG: hypothetical protein EBZ48_02775 [Proteobacteria bacterium]|nr:hypothetical protein [Pseudomonadota bacterium]